MSQVMSSSKEGGAGRESRGVMACACALSYLAASGCADLPSVGPDYVKPEVTLNASWSESGSARVARQTSIDRAWWTTFNDETLNNLIEEAYKQNLDLRISGLRILEARALLGVAVGLQFPENPGAIASAEAVGLSQHAPNSRGLDYQFGNYQVGFDAVWEVDFWGKYRRGVRAETASYFATLADYDNALVALSAEVARTYVQIRTFEVLLMQAQQNVAVEEEGQRIAESRYRHGATSQLDVNQATTLLESTRTTIPKLTLSLRQSQNALCTLLGRPTGCTGTGLMAAASVIPMMTAPLEVIVPAEILRRRPDIRVAELRAIAQCEHIGVAKAELYPSLVLAGAIGIQTSSSGGAQSGNSTLANLVSPTSLLYSLGGSLFWPIFKYPRILNNVRVQDARYQELLVDYQQTVLKAAQEVEDELAGFLREEEAAVYAQNAALAAEVAMKLAVVQYREGATDYQRVVDTQRVLLQTQEEFARTRSAVSSNAIALYKALGGGWEMRQGQPTVPEFMATEMQKRTNWGRYFGEPLPANRNPAGIPAARK